MKPLMATLILLSTLPSSVGNAEDWSIERLDLDIQLLPQQSRAMVQGRASLRLDADASHGPVLGVNSRKRVSHFRAVRVLSPDRAHKNITPQTLEEGKPTEIAPIRFEEPFRKGDRIEIEFENEITDRAGQIVVTPDFALGSWVEFWYPVPGSKESGFGSPAAPGTTAIRMPATWRGIAPGTLMTEKTEGSERIEIWRTVQAAARSFAAGPLTRLSVGQKSGPPVAFYVLKESADYISRADTLSRAIAAMEERFGPYPYDSWNVVEVPEDLVSFAAASEQGFILVRSSVLADGRGALPLLAHEAAHGWWGNRVKGSGPGGRMFTEALAQFGAVLAIEKLEGEQAAIEFLRFSRPGYNPLQCALGYFHIWREGGDKPLAELFDGRWDHNLADAKGHWFYWMLRHRLGDELFFPALRRILERFTNRKPTVRDLRAIFLEAAPHDTGLAGFLDQWLLRRGAPVLDVAWWSVERGAAIELIIEQLQEGLPFVFDLEVELDLHDGSRVVEVVNIGGRHQVCRLMVPSRPLGVHLDPRHRLLIWRPEYGPPP